MNYHFGVFKSVLTVVNWYGGKQVDKENYEVDYEATVDLFSDGIDIS